jgi:hypothetical protein
VDGIRNINPGCDFWPEKAMNHLTDYSQAWAREGERADAIRERQDAIQAELTGDYQALADLIAETLAGREKSDLIQALAYHMAASWGAIQAETWADDFRNSMDKDQFHSVGDIIDAEIAARMIIEGDKE